MLEAIDLRNFLRPIFDAIDPGRRIRHRISKDLKAFRYRGLMINEPRSGNELISSSLESGEPFAAGKFGATESKLFRSYLRSVRSGDRQIESAIAQEIFLHSGYFPTDYESLSRFAEFYQQCAASVDMLGVWYQSGEIDLIKRANLSGSTFFFEFTGLEPYYFSIPWSRCLEGKKVCVISPFVDSIKSQYEKKELIWPNGLLPDFELIGLRFPHSVAHGSNGYESWDCIYNDFTSKMDALDFDVALIGAGAATLPLTTYAKVIGKQAIGLGGALQIMFGICGRRWDHHPFFRELINDHWVRPSGSEVPSKHSKIENAAYW